MAYTPVSFVADEILTSTKMNQLAANDASFNDGTGIGNGTILLRHLANEAKNIEYVAKIGSGEYGEGEILSIPASQLDINANYLVIASACTNYNGASGDFIMNVRGSGDAIFISATQSVNGWMATLTSAGVSKPSSSKGFTMALSMNGHKTQGTNPPRMVAVRLTY